MITISHPVIEKREKKAYLISKIKDENRSLESELWFSVDEEYKDYLCDDYADCFLVCLLLIAIRTEQDIKVEAPVSRKLLFNIQNTMIPLFMNIFTPPTQRVIKVIAEAKDDLLFKAKGVGCGCSLGVDSLSSFLKHYGENVMDGYKVTHLTLFNSGQLGDYDLEGVEENFRKSVEELKPFSEAVNLPVVAINSNLNSFYRYSGVSLLQSFVNRTVCCALALQKLFDKYVYASSYTIKQFNFSTVDQSHMEATYAPLFSTENMELILSNPMLTRVEKTEFISKSPLTPRFLQVCWAEQTALEVWHNTAFLEGKTKKNCGWCDKCLRTLLTLEVLGRNLEEYGEQFELSKYYEHRDKYIEKVFKEYKSNIFYEEMVELMIARNYPLSSKVRYIYKWSVTKERIKVLFFRVIRKMTNMAKWLFL